VALFLKQGAIGVVVSTHTGKQDGTAVRTFVRSSRGEWEEAAPAIDYKWPYAGVMGIARNGASMVTMRGGGAYAVYRWDEGRWALLDIVTKKAAAGARPAVDRSGDRYVLAARDNLTLFELKGDRVSVTDLVPLGVSVTDVRALALAAEGDVAAFGDARGVVTLVRWGQRREVAKTRVGAGVTALRFHPEQRLLAVVDWRNRVSFVRTDALRWEVVGEER
jgi:hypothetical protein